MAWAFRGVTTFGDSNGTTATASIHADVVEGDHMRIDLYLEDAVSTVVSITGGGWTILHSIQNTASVLTHWAWERIATSSEPSSYALTWGGGAFWRSLVVNAWSGGDATTIRDATPSENEGVGTVATWLSITTSNANALLVAGEIDFDGRNVNPPSGWTERTDFGNCQLSDFVQVAAGASGNKTGNITGGSSEWCAILGAFKIAAAAGGIIPLIMHHRSKNMGVS